MAYTRMFQTRGCDLESSACFLEKNEFLVFRDSSSPPLPLLLPSLVTNEYELKNLIPNDTLKKNHARNDRGIIIAFGRSDSFHL
mmetsp:Transcript_21976/g.27187  ORF Transcript_21976/g.27187 Transcript_21976/m.27187 type:complete len:84 (+) Transcript_21976:82-333(+)